jgi:hypothetical protein
VRAALGRAGAALLALLALGSCGTLSEETCRQGNWSEIGYRDGSRGRSADFVSNHAQACGKVGVTPDLAAWRAGRVEGLRRYCTPQNAYDAGLGGNRLNPVCPASDRLRLALAEDQGLRIHAVRREIDRLDYANASDEARLDDLLTGELDKEDRRRVRKLRRDIEDRNYEIRRLEREAQFSRPGFY